VCGIEEKNIFAGVVIGIFRGGRGVGPKFETEWPKQALRHKLGTECWNFTGVY
jgi:hypothetical protein